MQQFKKRLMQRIIWTHQFAIRGHVIASTLQNFVLCFICPEILSLVQVLYKIYECFKRAFKTESKILEWFVNWFW